MVLVAVTERWFDRIGCEEFRCRRDAALAERVFDATSLVRP
jgi:hypothetical protein